MVIRPCEPRGSSWPADYRSYAVELHRKIEAGTITKQEAQLRLANRYPRYDLPDERTWRRWAHEKYRDLPEQRSQFFSAQAADPEHIRHQVLVTPSVYPLLPVHIRAPSMVFQIEELFRPMMNIVVALAMMRVAVSVGDYVGKSLNDMLKGTT